MHARQKGRGICNIPASNTYKYTSLLIKVPVFPWKYSITLNVHRTRITATAVSKTIKCFFHGIVAQRGVGERMMRRQKMRMFVRKKPKKRICTQRPSSMTSSPVLAVLALCPARMAPPVRGGGVSICLVASSGILDLHELDDWVAKQKEEGETWNVCMRDEVRD